MTAIFDFCPLELFLSVYIYICIYFFFNFNCSLWSSFWYPVKVRNSSQLCSLYFILRHLTTYLWKQFCWKYDFRSQFPLQIFFRTEISEEFGTKSFLSLIPLFQSLLCALRESHKVRLMFRRSGGYLCLMSLLVGLEGKLSSNAEETIPEMLLTEITNLLRFTEIIFKVLAISMRYEPSNSKYFTHEVICYFQFLYIIS